MFYFEQAFVFYMLIKKNVLEWFLFMVLKEHTLLKSTNLFSRNHPNLYFRLIREGRQMPNTELLHLEEHLCTVASELTLESDCLKLCF